MKDVRADRPHRSLHNHLTGAPETASQDSPTKANANLTKLLWLTTATQEIQGTKGACPVTPGTVSRPSLGKSTGQRKDLVSLSCNLQKEEGGGGGGAGGERGGRRRRGSSRGRRRGKEYCSPFQECWELRSHRSGVCSNTHSLQVEYCFLKFQINELSSWLITPSAGSCEIWG